MKNKNFTPKVNTLLGNAYIVLLFLFAFAGVQNLNAQAQDCPLSCNDMIQVSLDDECIAVVTPEMIIEGENDAVICDYEIYTIVDENNNVVGHADGNGNWILDGDAHPDYTYKTLMATVGYQSNHDNSCMGGLRLEDKIAPTLRCLDTVYVSCSEDLSDYLNTDTDFQYGYTGPQEIINSVGPNYTDFPFVIGPGGNVDIPYDVVNQAHQSEIMNFVQAVLSLSTTSNMTVQIVPPGGGMVNTLTSPFKDDSYYGDQAVDPLINGTWHIVIFNGNAYDVTVNSAKLRIKSTGFLRIGNGVIVNDNCHLSEATISVLSDYTNPNDTACATYFQERVIKYQGTDWRGMKTPVCTHVIRWLKKGFDDMEWPHNWDGIDQPPLSCTGHFMQETPDGDFTETGHIWDANGDGYPQPGEVDVPTIDGVPIWPDPHYCMLNVTYSDEVIDICPGSFKVLRKWIAYDMCEPGGDDCCNDDANPRTHYQIIKVIDNTPITFETNHLGYIEVSANPFDCSACVTLPVPLIQNYGCSEGYTYEVGYCATGNGIFNYFDNITSRVVNGETVYTICNLPVGETCVRYILTDLCGNKSEGTLTVKVIDDIPPIPVCDEHTVATVTTDCTARVKAETFDDGSFDNCSEVSFKVAKMHGSSIGVFRDYVDFGSSDVGKSSQVVLKVIDDQGNWNTCMVEVYVDDKIPPQVFCPDNVTIDCNVDPHDVDLTGGEADYWDNCGAQLTHEDFGSLNQCNVGTIRRVWRATDNGGRKASCTQYIYVTNTHPFVMRNRYWPRDVNNLLGCSNADTDPSNTGEPDLSADDYCSMVASTHTDRVFNVVEDACYKILRDWTVIDWCQYSDDDPYYLGQPGHPYEGMWVHTQVIMVNDYNAPVITSSCTNQNICAYNSDCTGDVSLTAEADDECTPDEELVWSYRVTGPNLSYPLVGNTNTFTRNHMQLGWYDIEWTVEDKCGNISECSYSFHVVDCKNPTPLCYSEITTVLMPTTNPRMVTINARDFDRGSDDNCDPGATCGECNTDLRFSFSGTNPNETTRTFTEGDEGLHTLDMWVWDQAGNRDFCTVTIYIQDNVDPGTNALIAGQVITEDDKKVEKVKVDLTDVTLQENKIVETNTDGFYEFSVPEGKDYKLKADKNDDYLNGLTTLDLVLIQKHILGIKDLSTPYKLLAADANNDRKISASDILMLRKLILGMTDDLDNKAVWTFVDNKYEFENPKNPWLSQGRDMYSIELNGVGDDMMDNHFIAVKTGDVNNSVRLNSSSAELNSRGIMSLNIDNVSFKSGEIVKIPVKSTSNIDLSGMQFSLKLNDNLELKDVEADNLKIDKNNYSLHNNTLFFSWNVYNAQQVNEDETLFTIVLKAKSNGQLINQMNLVNDLSPEAYNKDLDIIGLELNYRNAESGEFALYQNTPNPFNNETEISFNLPKSGQVSISVFDVTGKVILKKTGKFEKGYNSVKMSKDDLKNISGVLYYKVENGENMAVKKMILLAK